jgi:hypothetical protein
MAIINNVIDRHFAYNRLLMAQSMLWLNTKLISYIQNYLLYE